MSMNKTSALERLIEEADKHIVGAETELDDLAIIERLVAVVKRQREFIESYSGALSNSPDSVNARRTEIDCESLAGGCGEAYAGGGEDEQGR